MEELLKKKGFPTKPGVIRRMLQTFPNQVNLAEARGDIELARDMYHQADALPSFETAKHFQAEYFELNGPLFPGSALITAYRGLSSFVIKPHADTNERNRVLAFNAAVCEAGRDSDGMLIVHRHVIPFKLWVDPDRPERMFMLMPKLSSTLEPIPKLTPELITLCWDNLSSALRCVHEFGFAHGDIKPANIGVREGRPGELVLLDLGSIQRFGLRAIATEPYVPEDLPTPHGFIEATQCLDWWMLAVTICEKGCGLAVGEGAALGRRAPPRRSILGMCTGHQGLIRTAADLLLELIKCEDDVALE